MKSFFNIRIVLNSLFFILILYFAFNFKEKFTQFDKEYITLNKDVYNIRLSENKNIDILKNSVIRQKYNNDIIVVQLKKHEKLIQNFYNKKNLFNGFSKIFEYEQQHKQQYKKIQNLFYRFMQYNAMINNSLIYLNNELKQLHKYDKTFIKHFPSVVSLLIQQKSDFDSETFHFDKHLQFFINYKGNNENYNLIAAHIKLLQSHIPRFKQIIENINNYNGSEIVKKLENSIINEAKTIDQELMSEFLVLIIIFSLVSIAIIALMIKGDKDSQKILNLIKKNEKNLRYDKLTGAFSRSAFYKDMKDISKEDNLSVIMVDIDKFNKINAIVGYKGGDYILKQVTTILKKYGDVYRVSADEFLTVLSCKDKCSNEINNILTDISTKSFIFDGFEVPVSIHIGITDQKPYIKTAELAIESAKKTNEDYAVFTENLDDSKNAKDNITMLKKVNYALENDNIKPFFQPLVCLKTKKTIKYESLVRLIDNNKPISPYFFLDITKGSKTYQNITKRVMEKSLSLIKKENIPVSINISFEDIEDQNTLSFINFFLIKNKQYAPMITFELLESESIDDFEMVIDFIKMVKNYGCSIAIDDFGSGYSNFEYLFKLEPDILKIDGSLIKDIHTNEKSKIIVESIVSLATKSNIKTVAEFVDNEQVDTIITNLGIDYGQGYYYSPPKDIL